MPVKPAALSLLLAAAACGPVGLEPAAGPAESRGEAIVGGTVTTGDPNVFMLLIQGNNGQGSICTATLIAPRTLLTAAHCVDPRIIGAQSVQLIATNAPTQSQIVLGQNTWDVVETRIHPAWSTATLSGDIAMARLQSAPNVALKPWNQEPVAAGQAVRSVGYGITGPNTTNSGVKRTVDLEVNQATPTLLFVGNGVNKGICSGDSGGPMFRTFPDGVERVVGVHSFTRTQSCTDGAATRVDAYSAFIQQWLSEKEEPSCGSDGRCAAGCPMKDVDCVDEGRACTSATQCAGRRCVVDPQNTRPYCSRTCSTSADCSAGMDCGSDGACRFRQLPTAGLGEACTPGGTFCGETVLCTGPSATSTRCALPCSDASQCPRDFSCATGIDGRRYCLEPPKPLILLRRAELTAPEFTGCSTGLGLAPSLGLLLLLRRRARPA